jgi:ubiquinone/menaquinone biosynthesis C-methylase UbiE
MKKDTYLENAKLYDFLISKSKIYRIGDKPFLDIIKKICKNISVSIFEPGCGTGLITKELVKIKNANIIAADPSQELITAAKIRFKKYKNIKLIRKSAVDLKIKPVDIIAMRYVYHHIPDSKKSKFVKNMYSNLKKKRKIIILDEFLPFYSNKKEWKQTLIKFHDNKTEIALKMHDKVTADCEQESKKLGLKKVDEFKVHLKILEKQLKNAGFSKIKKSIIKHPRLKDSKPLGLYLITAEK